MCLFQVGIVCLAPPHGDASAELLFPNLPLGDSVVAKGQRRIADGPQGDPS